MFKENANNYLAASIAKLRLKTNNCNGTNVMVHQLRWLREDPFFFVLPFFLYIMSFISVFQDSQNHTSLKRFLYFPLFASKLEIKHFSQCAAPQVWN